MKRLPRSVKQGPLRLGKWQVNAYVLDSGMRLISRKDSFSIFSSEPEHIKNELSSLVKHPSMRDLPNSVAAMAFLDPQKFVDNSGKTIEGTDAESVVAVCRFFLRAREYKLIDTRIASTLAQVAESLIVSIAHVGLAALIDEATGFQQIREKNALQALLDQYLRKELAVWAKRFPDEFYMQIFRLKGWDWQGMRINRPGVVGMYTRDIVYARIAPGVLVELERRNPSDGHGKRTDKHHQWLTDDIGHPALQQHLYAVIGLMRASSSWSQFNTLLKRSFPRKGDQLDLLDLSESDLD